MELSNKKSFEEKIITPSSGGMALLGIIVIFLASVAALIFGIIKLDASAGADVFGGILIAVFVVLLIGAMIMCCGLKIIDPNEALVLTLFGKYYGTIATEGFFFVNPFCSAVNPAYRDMVSHQQQQAAQGQNIAVAVGGNKKISLKAMTLNNEKQKVNDQDGNPIEIGVIVIWKIINASNAVFNVDNYKSFVSTQCDSAIRHVARSYPYDVSTKGEEQSLRGSSSEIAEVLRDELQSRTLIAGIEILEARISHLAYAPEIAAVMLQRQQASAIIAARQMIVEGAVGMVEMALNKLSENNVVNLDDERKAQMVSNLLVVLCGNKDAQPIVNSGMIY